MKPDEVLKAEYKKRIDMFSYLMETAPTFHCTLLVLISTINALKAIAVTTCEENNYDQ